MPMHEMRDERREAVTRRRPTGPLAPTRRVLGAGALTLIALGAVLGTVLPGAGPRVVKARVSGIRGSAELHLAADQGQLIVRALTPPPPGEVYEVWLEPAHSAPLPTQVLFTATSADMKLPPSLSGIARLFVTPEPVAGSIAPTHAPVIVVQLG